MELHIVLTQKIKDMEIFKIWHERLGHPGTIMVRRINTSSHGHSLNDYRILTNNEYARSACSTGKLITRPSVTKVTGESPKFLERIQEDICRPIHPS